VTLSYTLGSDATHPAVHGGELASPEILDRVMPPDALPELRIRRFLNTSAFISDMNAFADNCRDNALLPSRTGRYIAWGYNHVMTPNQNSCFNGPRTDPNYSRYLANTSTSRHVGGVHVLFADGSVEFVSDSIDRQIWWSIGTRNGHEPLTYSR
jgi:prepilin-type processing-associated H-X9-DG protein